MTQPTLGTRVYLLERDRDSHAKQLDEHEARIDKTESRLDVIGARLGVYAAIGATVGGILASAIAVAVVKLVLGH